MKNAKSKHKTLEETKALWIRAHDEWPLRATRRERVIEAILSQGFDYLVDEKPSDLREYIQELHLKGVKGLQNMNAEELWQEALDAWCFDGEQDWADEDIREPFLQWLEDECGIVGARS